MWRFKIFFFSLVVAIVLAFGVNTVTKQFVKSYIDDLMKDTSFDLDKLKIEPKPTYVFDTDEDLMTKQKKEKKYQTKLSDVPKSIQNAVLSTEDRYFYTHPGINAKSLFRALLDVVKNGEFTQGGSTITQQLVKTIYLTNDKDFSRKIVEINMALSLESQLSKEKVLENYLNHIYYGQDSYGIKDAVRTYFGQTFDEFEQDDKQSQIVKAALLAGIIQRPSAYDPYKNPDLTLKRRNDVLLYMWNAGTISKEEYEKAIEYDLMILPEPQRVAEDEEMKHGEILQYVFDEASKILEMDPEEVRYSGVKIYTSFDPEVYAIIRKHYDNPNNFHSNASDGEIVQSAAIFSNPQTGEILAFTGGRNIPEYSQFNRVYSEDMKRQPGSSFKPIAVYAPALNTGKFSPSSKLVNSKTNFGSGAYPYIPENWNNKYSPYMTMTEALKMSMNVPAVWTLKQVGVNNAKNYLKSVGIDLTNDESGLSMALGGLQYGVKPIQMADAFQPFANGGHRIPLHIINRIVTAEGEVIYESNTKLSSKTRVLKEKAADYMRYMLENAVKNGTGSRAKVSGQMIAGKTGSTQSEFRNGKDNDGWFVGFNKYYVGAIWMGFDVSNENRYLTNASSMPSQLFSEIMTDLTKIKPDPSSNYSKPTETKPKVNQIGLNASYNEADKTVYLSWDTKEEVYFQLLKNGGSLGDAGNISSYSDRDFKEGDSITYQVIGYDMYNNFPLYESKSITIRIPNGEPLPTPSGFGTKPTINSFDISWNEVPGATTYRLTMNNKTIYEGPFRIFTVNGLTPNTSYTVTLMAFNDTNQSKAVSVTVQTLPVATEPPSTETPPTDTPPTDSTPPEDNDDIVVNP